MIRTKMEIERKFRLRNLPDPEILGNGVIILQGYLVVEPDEIRVRSCGSKYYITIKSSGTLVRREWNKEIPKWVFEALWHHTETRRIKKTRYSIPFRDLTLELDEYHGKLEGLAVLECEFPSKEDAQSFALPKWASNAVDVTADDRYKNKYLAAHEVEDKI